MNYDAIIIGGGPAGATAAAILAQHRRKVLVLEKDSFPRYHIGESLIPYCYYPLQRIGMVDKLKQSRFTKKYSVQFASIGGKVSQPFYFFNHLDNEVALTWQVTRAEFDTMLLENARQLGADVRNNIRVKSAIEEDGSVKGVVAQDAAGNEHVFRAPLTIDASGRNGFFATRKGWRIHDEKLKKVAIWTYFKGAKRDPGYDEGATTVAYLPQKGWFWYIPLVDDTVSVGVVADKDYLYDQQRDPAAIFRREVAKNLWIKDHLSTGTQFGQYQVTGDFSYRSRYCAADGIVLTGDAFAFLDPVFSSGLYFALLGGQLAGDAAEKALQENDVSAGRFSEYGEAFCAAIEAMRKLVYAFYDREFNFKDFLTRYPHLAADVTDCLIGNVEKDFSEMFEAVKEFADVPAPLPHGRPYIVSEKAAG